MDCTVVRRKIASLLTEAKLLADKIREEDVSYFIGMAGIAVIEAQAKVMPEISDAMGLDIDQAIKTASGLLLN